MTVNEHTFVLETPPLSVADFCPDCLAPWEFCSCELPSFDEIRDTYETERKH